MIKKLLIIISLIVLLISPVSAALYSYSTPTITDTTMRFTISSPAIYPSSHFYLNDIEADNDGQVILFTGLTPSTWYNFRIADAVYPVANYSVDNYRTDDVYPINPVASVSSNDIVFTFSPSLYGASEIYFNNEKVEYPVYDELIFSDLTPNTGYALSVNDTSGYKPYFYQIYYTSEEEKTDTFLQYGTIGIMLLIIVFIFLSSKSPYMAYIAFILSIIGFIYTLKNSNEFMELLIFVLLIIGSGSASYRSA